MLSINRQEIILYAPFPSSVNGSFSSLLQIENVQFLVLLDPSFAILVGTWRTSSIDHSQAAAPFFPPRHTGPYRPPTIIPRPPTSDL